jgi:hypothetical protein
MKNQNSTRAFRIGIVGPLVPGRQHLSSHRLQSGYFKS